MTPEDALRAAADAIGQMPKADVQRKLAQLKEARKARSQREILRQQEELDSLELDEAAYHAASQSRDEGDLREAARWYHAAAINDFAEAPLKLAMVLDSLAAEYLAEPGSQTAEEMTLVAQAAQWYAAAYAAGEIEAAELLDNLISRHDPTRPRTRRSTAVADNGKSSRDQCALGGWQNVILLDGAEVMEHCRSCRLCQEELLTKLPPWQARASTRR